MENTIINPLKEFDSYEMFEEYFYDKKKRKMNELFVNTFTSVIDEEGLDMKKELPPEKLRFLYNNNIHPQWVLLGNSPLENSLFSTVVVGLVKGNPLIIRTMIPLPTILDTNELDFSPPYQKNEEGILIENKEYVFSSNVTNLTLRQYLEKLSFIQKAVIHNDIKELSYVLSNVEASYLIEALFDEIQKKSGSEIVELFKNQYKSMEYNHDIFDKDRMEQIGDLLHNYMCDTEYYQSLPEYVTIYRGESTRSNDVLVNDEVYSWTTNRETAEFFAFRFQSNEEAVGKLLSVTIPKKLLLFSFTDDIDVDPEHEVLFRIHSHEKLLKEVKVEKIKKRKN